MQQKIDRLTDILRRDDGISGAMSYTEQISWILFLKYLNDYEEEKANEALINGTDYTYILDKEHRFEDFLNIFEERKETDNSWIVKINDIQDYDLSAKNPNNKIEIDHLPPKEILIQIRDNEKSVSNLLNEIEEILTQKD